jgi:hypothetical protein
MSVAIQAPSPQSASLALSILQSKAGNRWGRAVSPHLQRAVPLPDLDVLFTVLVLLCPSLLMPIAISVF